MSGFVQFTDLPGNARDCEHCGQRSDGSDFFGGPDPCLGRLPDVETACCGHGRLFLDPPRDTCYIEFVDERATLFGDEARAAMRALDGNPPAKATA